MEVTIKSYHKEREKEILDKLVKGLEKAGAIVERQAKINVSKSPPEHPQVQTGRLRSSIIHEVEGMSVTIGTNVEYAKSLEFGNDKHPPYPWLFPATEEKREEIKDALLGRGFTID